MENREIAEILNGLLAREQRNLASALMESTLFISHVAVADGGTIEAFVESSKKDGEMLANAIAKLGFTPGLRRVDLSGADLHFQDLHTALPRLRADREKLVDIYTRAAQRLADVPDVLPLVQRILEKHREETRSLKDSLNRPVGNPT